MITGMVSSAGGRPLLEQRHAIGVGHPDVEQNQVGAVAQSGGAGLGGVFGHFDRVAFVVEDFLQQVADAKLVINHQNVCHDFLRRPLPFRAAAIGCAAVRLSQLSTANDNDTCAPSTLPSSTRLRCRRASRVRRQSS
jgi:hypothetical protein